MIVNRQPFDYAKFCAEMAKRLPCQHANAKPRKKGTKPNGSIYYRYQCPDCGAQLQPSQLKHKIVRDFEAQGGVVEDWDELAVDRFYEIRSKHAEEIKQQYAWDFGGWWRRYTNYLESEEWRAIRQKVLERDGHVCRKCSKHVATQVHHENYDRAGHELESDLISVCIPCHEAIHRK